MSIFSSRWNCWIVALIVQYTKFVLAFKYLAQFFPAFLPRQVTPKESVFSLKLFNVRADHDDRKQFQLAVAWEKTFPHELLFTCSFLVSLEIFQDIY